MFDTHICMPACVPIAAAPFVTGPREVWVFDGAASEPFTPRNGYSLWDHPPIQGSPMELFQTSELGAPTPVAGVARLFPRGGPRRALVTCFKKRKISTPELCFGESKVYCFPFAKSKLPCW